MIGINERERVEHALIFFVGQSIEMRDPGINASNQLVTGFFVNKCCNVSAESIEVIALIERHAKLSQLMKSLLIARHWKIFEDERIDVFGDPLPDVEVGDH